MIASRRLAAILAADIVGYSRMMGEDEAGTAEFVRESRAAAGQTIEAHRGRIFKTMGDGFLVEFPSVVAAVECALALQAERTRLNEGLPEAKRLLYRMGVNLGDVLVEGDDLVGAASISRRDSRVSRHLAASAFQAQRTKTYKDGSMRG